MIVPHDATWFDNAVKHVRCYTEDAVPHGIVIRFQSALANPITQISFIEYSTLILDGYHCTRRLGGLNHDIKQSELTAIL